MPQVVLDKPFADVINVAATAAFYFKFKNIFSDALKFRLVLLIVYFFRVKHCVSHKEHQRHNYN